MHFSAMYRLVNIGEHSPAMGRQTSAGWENASTSLHQMALRLLHSTIAQYRVIFRISVRKNKYNYSNECNIIQYDAD